MLEDIIFGLGLFGGGMLGFVFYIWIWFKLDSIFINFIHKDISSDDLDYNKHINAIHFKAGIVIFIILFLIVMTTTVAYYVANKAVVDSIYYMAYMIMFAGMIGPCQWYLYTHSIDDETSMITFRVVLMTLSVHLLPLLTIGLINTKIGG